MGSINRSLGRLILQVLRDKGYTRTAHMFEQESRLFFDMKYFESLVLSGNWFEAEYYLMGFTKPDDNQLSNTTYLEIRKIAYFEALRRKDVKTAMDILTNGLQPLFLDKDFKEMFNTMSLLFLKFSKKQAQQEREALAKKLKTAIEFNPLFRGKLVLPSVDNKVLNRFLNGLNISNPDQAADDNFPPFQAAIAVPAVSSANTTAPNRIPMGFGYVASREGIGSSRDLGQSSKSNKIPRTVTTTLNTGTRPTSMNFHPLNSVLLLVGTCVGNIGMWDVCTEELIFYKIFTVQNLQRFSTELQIELADNPSKHVNDAIFMNPDGSPCQLRHRFVAVTRIIWSPDASLFGVAYSTNIVQIFSVSLGVRAVRIQCECEAHKGSVNDLAFITPLGRLLFITCGNDKTVKVWNAKTGAVMICVRGHEAPVYSVCPLRSIGIVDFIYSVSLDGKLHISFYSNQATQASGSPYFGQTRFISSTTNGLRIFSGGTGKNGVSVLLEWEHSSGSVKRTYKGLRLCQRSVVQFGLSSNLLAAGDDHLIKFWDIDNDELLEAVRVNGVLPVTPQLCFNRPGTLLAVEAKESRIVILASDRGLKWLSSMREIVKRCGLYARERNILGKTTRDDSSGEAGSNSLGGDDNDEDHTSKGKEIQSFEPNAKRPK